MMLGRSTWCVVVSAMQWCNGWLVDCGDNGGGGDSVGVKVVITIVGEWRE